MGVQRDSADKLGLITSLRAAILGWLPAVACTVHLYPPPEAGETPETASKESAPEPLKPELVREAKSEVVLGLHGDRVVVDGQVFSLEMGDDGRVSQRQQHEVQLSYARVVRFGETEVVAQAKSPFDRRRATLELESGAKVGALLDLLSGLASSGFVDLKLQAQGHSLELNLFPRDYTGVSWKLPSNPSLEQCRQANARCHVVQIPAARFGDDAIEFFSELRSLDRAVRRETQAGLSLYAALRQPEEQAPEQPESAELPRAACRPWLPHLDRRTYLVDAAIRTQTAAEEWSPQLPEFHPAQPGELRDHQEHLETAVRQLIDVMGTGEAPGADKVDTQTPAVKQAIQDWKSALETAEDYCQTKVARYESAGRMPKKVIQRRIRSHYSAFRTCYEAGLGRDRNLEGRVAVRFVINRDGTVSGVSDAGSSLPDPQVIRCLLDAYAGIRFPPPDGGIVTVIYPIMFHPGDEAAEEAGSQP